MVEIKQLAETLRKASQTAINYNYTIPQFWDTFGYEKGKRLRSHEMIVNPYDFYAFALEQISKQCAAHHTIAQEKGKHGAWIHEQIICDLDMMTFTSWDHDRDDHLDRRNLYDLSDQGTCLKAVILLPILKRAGVTTLLLHHFLALDQKRSQHDLADPHAIRHPYRLHEALADPLLPDVSLEDQFALFIHTAHALGLRVIGDFSPAKMGRDNDLLAAHPEWFYWIRKDEEAMYHAPKADALPIGCIPSKNACKVLYQSIDVKEHLNRFVIDPKTSNPEQYELLHAQQKLTSLSDIEQLFGCTSAPAFSDQINASLPVEEETTMLRFYQDQPMKQAPYLLQDICRPDLFPQKKELCEVWEFIKDSAAAYMETFHMDGLMITGPWQLPRKLIRQIIQRVRSITPHAAILLEETQEDRAAEWKKIGIDLITGGSAYSIHDVFGYAYHTFAYSRFSASHPVLAASEFRDTPRIMQHEGQAVLAQLLAYMNLFLPNTVPYFASGQLFLEQQPQALSPFADHQFINALPNDDPRCYKQALLDHSWYSYTNAQVPMFFQQLSRFVKIRQEYASSLHAKQSIIPVWFDDPKDPGIGFTYTQKDKALLVVCNTNVFEVKHLRIHTENMLWELPFTYARIRQIYSNYDPFVSDVEQDQFQNLPMEFQPGEVKCLEIS